MVNKWIAALKLWNTAKDNGKWCVPKKGSGEIEEVRRIMKGEPAAPAAAPKIETPPPPKKSIHITDMETIWRDQSKLKMQSGTEFKYNPEWLSAITKKSKLPAELTVGMYVRVDPVYNKQVHDVGRISSVGKDKVKVDMGDSTIHQYNIKRTEDGVRLERLGEYVGQKSTITKQLRLRE